MLYMSFTFIFTIVMQCIAQDEVVVPAQLQHAKWVTRLRAVRDASAHPPTPSRIQKNLQHYSIPTTRPPWSVERMPSSLAKVQKHVRKKKGDKSKSLHENSRDAQRLRRATNRDERVAKLGAIKKSANRQWIDRILFCVDHLPDTLHPLEVDEMRSLIQDFVDRNSEELSQLKAERRPGRPPSTRQVLLEQQRDVDAKEFESGFWMPNLQDAETLVKLNDWSGDWISLANMRFVRLRQDGEVKESQFPPRGAS